MSELFAPVCSITATRRRRFFWAAWWTAPPSREPFRRPDAAEGGARSRREALERAEAAASSALLEIDSRWARAASRVLKGEPPWTAADLRGEPGFAAPSRCAPRAGSQQPLSIWQQLGVAPDALVADIKRAYKQRALETHPDRGGTPESFREVQRAYEEALKRRAKRARRPARKTAGG